MLIGRPKAQRLIGLSRGSKGLNAGFLDPSAWSGRLASPINWPLMLRQTPSFFGRIKKNKRKPKLETEQ
jgi:hypothetical protein